MSDITKPTMDGLLEYLNYQYPETCGNIPLREFCQKLKELNAHVEVSEMLELELKNLKNLL